MVSCRRAIRRCFPLLCHATTDRTSRRGAVALPRRAPDSVQLRWSLGGPCKATRSPTTTAAPAAHVRRCLLRSLGRVCFLRPIFCGDVSSEDIPGRSFVRFAVREAHRDQSRDQLWKTFVMALPVILRPNKIAVTVSPFALLQKQHRSRSSTATV